MNLQKLTACKIMLGLALAVLMFYSILVGDSILSVVAFITALIFLILLRSRVETVTVDERIHLMSEKASRKTLQLFGLSAVLIGFILLVASHIGYADLSQSGNTLLYSASFISILYLIFWHYYRRKYGG